MSNITKLFKEKQGYEVQYILNGELVVGVTHSKWPYAIVRNGKQRALVCKETDEPFGKLQKDDFNTLLMCWLLIDDPELIDNAANKSKREIKLEKALELAKEMFIANDLILDRTFTKIDEALAT